MRTRNVLRSFIGVASTEDWGLGILRPVYSRPLLKHPATGGLLPYLAKGVDSDGDGTFEASEYGTFGKDSGTNSTDVVVYFDFNGVLWHDGAQMTVMDLFFTLVVSSLNPRFNTVLLVLWDGAGGPGSNFTSDRWIAVVLAAKSWENEESLPGDPNLRVAVRFRLQSPYARFYEDLLGGLTLLPRHVWEQTGGGRHLDFGRAIYPEGYPRAGQGIPMGETLFKAFDYVAAESWAPGDEDVIGSGPFRFGSLDLGVSTRIARNDLYYVGRDPVSPTVVYDPRLLQYLHLPFVGGFLFRTYPTLHLAALALQSGEIDYLRSNLSPEFVPDLLKDGKVRVWAYPETGFMYLGYNMRRPWLGYRGTERGDQADAGRPFRMAGTHLLDKRMFVSPLPDLGVIADSVVSPANTAYYNGSLPHRDYDLNAARTILDNAGFIDTDGDGWRELPVRGDSGLDILTPSGDYDPIRVAVGTMWAASMRSVGLNVSARALALSQILHQVEAHDFDMALLTWKISDPDPDYLFPLFHCSAEDLGLNFPGYCDSTLDATLERSRTTMDFSERVRLIRAAQGIIMDDRPVEPFLYQTSIQASSAVTFVNWSSEFGTLWTFWSWIGVKLISPPPQLIIDLRLTSAMAGGASQRIEAALRHLDGTPFVGATVAFSVPTEGDGSFQESGSQSVVGITGTTGVCGVTYMAPLVPGDPRFIDFDVVVTHEALYGPVRRNFVITVFHDTDRFLSLRVTLPSGDIGVPDTFTPIRIEVKDETGTPLADATVTATAVPSNATLTRTNGTAGDMAFILFSPPRDLGATMAFRVSLTATKTGYHAAHVDVDLLIAVLEPGQVPPKERPAGPSLGIVAAGVAVAGVFLVSAMWWATSRRKLRR